MIIEKLHSQGSATKIEESDLQAIRNLYAKYGSVNVLQAINEKEEKYRPKISNDFRATGGASVSGFSGVLQSIPSFALSFMISPTLTALAAVGALSHRIRTRWEDHESWRNRLMPGFWADNLANPGNYSIPHRVVSGTGKAIKGAGVLAAGAVLGPLAWPKLKQKYKETKENAPSWLKKLIGIGATAELAKKTAKDSSTDSSTLYDDSLTLTPEEVKNIDFKEYFIYLSNGEILRVKADNDANAKALGKLAVEALLVKKGWYSGANTLINNGYARYEFHFNDGEMCYSSGKNEKEALKAAQDVRTYLCNQINNSDTNTMKIDPLDIPKVEGKGIEKFGVEIPLPDKNKITVSTNPPRKQTAQAKKLKYPVYSYDGMSDYGVRVMNCQLHFPAYRTDEVVEMIRLFYTKYARNIFIEMENCSKRKSCDQFTIIMEDKDRYRIYATSEYAAAEIAMKLQEAKLAAAYSVLKTSRKSYDLDNLMSEFGSMIKKIKSEKKIPPKDYKEYKESRKVYITRNPSNEDERRDEYQPYEI